MTLEEFRAHILAEREAQSKANANIINAIAKAGK